MRLTAPAALAGLLCLPAVGSADLMFTAPAETVTVTFEAGSPGVNGTSGFAGGGLDAPGGTDGTLDSGAFAISGFSDGPSTFGSSDASLRGGDFARGFDADGGVSSGGLYAFGPGGNTILGFQPTGADFTPGSLFVRIQNATGLTLDSVDLSYDLFFNNDNARANSFNLSFGTGGDVADPSAIAFTPVAGLDFTSPGDADALGFQSVGRSTTFAGLSLADGDYLYLAFDSDDVSGAGSRDELGIDNISFTANVAAVPEPGTLALIGLAAGGFAVRRRRRAAA